MNLIENITKKELIPDTNPAKRIFEANEGLAKLPTNKGSKLLLTPNEPVFERVALFSLSKPDMSSIL